MVAFHRDAIQRLAERVIDADGEMGGTEIGYLLEGWGVRRDDVPPWAVCAPRAGQELYFERRNGRTVATQNPEPRRMTSVTMHRTDGFLL